MSLSLRNKLSGTHPLFAWAIEYILDYATQAGGKFTVTSVNRTAQKQWELFAAPNSKATWVGCSQHQYGLAADVVFEGKGWQEWYLASARNFGLSTVSGDPVHVQLIPGARFGEWSRAQGLCPDPRYPKVTPLPQGTQTASVCGPRAIGSSCNHLTGCQCFY